jgi:hypothetical protein
VKGDEIDRACSKNGAKRNCIESIGGETISKEATRRPRRRWVDNIKIDLRETG